MKTRPLETLVRIAQVNGFGKAAELQSMTLSALSMQMKALELELGAVLFDRSFRPPRLTPLGRQVAEQARVVIAQAQTLRDICAPTDGLSGHFHLGFIQSTSVRILPGFIDKARIAAPRARFQFTSGLSEALSELVLNSQLDAALVTQVGESDDALRFDAVAFEEL